MPYEIRNPQAGGSWGAADANSLDTVGADTGTVQAGAQYISFLNNGDGSGGGTDALVGVQGKMTRLPAGASRQYGGVGGQGGQSKQIFAWDSQGNDLCITVIF